MNMTSIDPRSEVARSTTNLVARIDLLDQVSFDTDDFETSKLLSEGDSPDHLLYDHFPYLYRSQGHLEDPERIGRLVSVVT